MGILRAEPLKAHDWAEKSVGSVWRAYDFQLTTYAVMLASFGLAMAYSNSVGIGQAPLAAGSIFVRGLLWAGMSACVFVVATLFDYRWLRTFAWPLYFLNIALLLLTLKIGSGTGQAGAAARWITVAGFQFQFSELAKVLMTIVLANYLASRSSNRKSVWTILGAGMLVAPTVMLVMLQPDLGTSLVMLAILAVLLFMSGTSLFWLTTFAAAAIAAVPVAFTHLLHPYQQARLLDFLDPAADPQGNGFQLLQAQAAVASGGPAGKGLTAGTLNLPVQTTDFVWAILAQELGFIGSMVVLLLFVVLLWRVLVCAWRAPDDFGMLIATGVGAMILFQLFVNIGMVIGIMPVTGIPLPFVTHGGASLVSLGAGLGLLQSINIRRDRVEW